MDGKRRYACSATVCAPYLSSGACMHSRGGLVIAKSGELRPHNAFVGMTACKPAPVKPAHRVAVYKALLTSEQNTQS